MQHHAAKRIQAIYRSWKAKDYFTYAQVSAKTIQAAWRGTQQRSQYRRSIGSVVLIQRAFRSYDAKRKVATRRNAIVKIQSAVRQYFAVWDFTISILAAIKVQAFWRRALARKNMLTLIEEREEHENMILQEHSAATVIQRAYLQYLLERFMIQGTVEIQRVWRGYHSRSIFTQTLHGFTKLQSVFRGQCVRKSLSRKISSAAARIAQANIVAKAKPQMILGKRTSTALLILQRSKRLSEIMTAIRTLETSTKLSPKCCTAFSMTGAHEILYSLIRSCNRSLPHVELLQYILMTLSNVAKHKDLIACISSRESVDILLDQIQMFRDKDSIFYLATALLERVVMNVDVLLRECKRRENLKRIKGVYSLCMRKTKGGVSSTSSSRAKSGGGKRISKEMSRGIYALGNVLHYASKEI